MKNYNLHRYSSGSGFVCKMYPAQVDYQPTPEQVRMVDTLRVNMYNRYGILTQVVTCDIQLTVTVVSRCGKHRLLQSIDAEFRDWQGDDFAEFERFCVAQFTDTERG